MTNRLYKKRTSAPDQSNQLPSQMQIHGARQIQRLIKPKIHLWLQSPCQCIVCKQEKPLLNHQEVKVRQYKQLSKKSHQWMKKVLIGLTLKISKPLKLFIPDILFVSGDGLQIFSTNKKDYRIIKFAGTTPVKAIFGTLTRLRKQYKGMLEENFRKTMIDKINPKFMHIKYFDRLLPSHFHDGDDSHTLSANKAKFKSYILNNNAKYIISSIQEHKMNDKEPFATIRYSQGNFQLLNQKQFELFSIVKLPEDVVYVQSYIKSKQSESIVISIYSQSNPSQQVDKQLWKLAELYVMVLLGGLSKYDEGYDELQNFEDEADQLMKSNSSAYAKLMTYQIVHFLAMASKIYIRHIKIKWIINDIDNLYLQQIIQFETQELSKRPIRYKMPPSSQIHNFYQDGDFFVQIHRQMSKKKEENLIKVKKQLKQKNYEDIIEQTTNRLIKKNQIETYTDNPQTIHQSNIYKRLTPRKKRNLSYLEGNQFHEDNKMSIKTKDSTIIPNSNRFSTITVRRSQSQDKQKDVQSRKNSINYQRRSISVFGDVMTRYEHKLIVAQRKTMNRSMNRYEKKTQKTQKTNKQKILDFQIHKSKKQYRATIDFA